MENNQFNEKQHCFFCGRKYYSDDPEFDSERKVCEHCAEQLDKDNPYINYMAKLD